jgi:hypothetical protein
VKGKAWKIWKYTIGSFSDDKTVEHDDAIAILRTCIVLVNFITCFFITANIIHNW